MQRANVRGYGVDIGNPCDHRYVGGREVSPGKEMRTMLMPDMMDLRFEGTSTFIKYVRETSLEEMCFD